MTKEQKASTIAALLHERLGYERRATKAKEDGDDEALELAEARVSGVDAELKKLGAAAEKPATRAVRRPSGQEAETR